MEKENNHNKDRSTLHFYYSTYSLIFLFILYISLKTIKNNTLKLIPYMLVISMALQCIIGECQLLGFAASNNRLFNITGSFFNPAILGGFISIILPITLILYKEETKMKWLKNTLLIIILISIIVLPATKSRAAIITTVIVCGYLYLVSSHTHQIYYTLG